ncbi:TetR/AcrR family transcriptional regulator [Sciscionella marina]|uniref:TetR/AcrR family transcriptional regulator n=1 Tax=Sciscionella marina TaxID=508770 RepID=UPI00038042F1|nr:TetR/AcrR family transcriptional regulator [Sciscionella marina]
MTRSTNGDRPSRPKDRTARLLAIAEELFGRYGYHAVSVADIAAAADISGPALYRHFSSKQELFARVLTEALDVTRTATEAALAEYPEAGRQRLRAITEALGELAVSRRTTLALWRWNASELDRATRVRIARESRTLLASLGEALRTDRGDISEDQAGLLCLAGLGVLGSVAVHRTRLAKGRFTELLADIAGRVLMARLPDPAAEIQPPPVAVPHGRREQILAAATELFAERGYSHVSMAEIGKAVGLAAASVYRHFPSKEQILLTVGQRMAERLTMEASRALGTANTPEQALGAVLESYVDTIWQYSDLATVYNTEMRSLSETQRAELLTVQRDYVSQWVSLLRKIDPDSTEAEARVIAHAGLTVVNDLARANIARDRPAHRAESVALARAALGLDVPAIAAGPVSG